MPGPAESIMGRDSPEQKKGKTTTVSCTTTASAEPFTLEVYHGWSPNGAERFVELVEDGFFTDVALFRCVKNFLVQFGVSPDAASPKKKYWRERGGIWDDPPLGIDFKRGMLSFAGGGANTRGTQLFITYKDLPHLGKSPWETPLGVVTQGMESVVDKFYQGYGDQQPFNEDGINQGTLMQRGNAYLRESFPNVSYFKECHVVGDPEAAGGGAAGGNFEDDVLWAPEKVVAPRKSDEEPWAVPDSVKREVPRRPAELGGAGAGDQGFSSLIFVLLAVACGAVIVVWKRSNRPLRRES